MDLDTIKSKMNEEGIYDKICSLIESQYPSIYNYVENTIIECNDNENNDVIALFGESVKILPLR